MAHLLDQGRRGRRGRSLATRGIPHVRKQPSLSVGEVGVRRRWCYSTWRRRQLRARLGHLPPAASGGALERAAGLLLTGSAQEGTQNTYHSAFEHWLSYRLG